MSLLGLAAGFSTDSSPATNVPPVQHAIALYRKDASGCNWKGCRGPGCQPDISIACWRTGAREMSCLMCTLRWSGPMSTRPFMRRP
eukprot:7496264-Prorocentrum_lima.AAC.1